MRLSLHKLKSTILHKWIRWNLRKLQYQEPAQPGKVITICGFFQSSSGIGQGARLLAEGLRELGYDIYAFDLTERLTPHLVNLDYNCQPDPGQGPIIIHANPTECLEALNVLGAKAVIGRLRIGYWVYELTTVPIHWVKGIPYFHTLWSPSNFSATAISKLGSNVIKLPYPFLDTKPVKIHPMPKAPFKVLTFADTQSSLDRKNPIDSIIAFKRAFKDIQNVELIIKISNSRYALQSLEPLKREINGDPRIILKDETLSSSKIKDLVRNCNVYISLHRSEGYGLTVIEALLEGVDAIFTSGTATDAFKHVTGAHLVSATQTRVIDPQGIYKSGEWALPNISEAQEHLISLYNLMMRPTSTTSITDRRKKIRRSALDGFGLKAFEQNFSSILRQSGLRKKM
jgi:glycosyltransferase involved in cell wall biosynthesis